MIATQSSLTPPTDDGRAIGLTHESLIEKPVRIRKRVQVGNDVRIGDVRIGSDVAIPPGVTIGDGAVAGAGAAVMWNVAARSVVGGVSTRPLFDRPEPKR